MPERATSSYHIISYQKSEKFFGFRFVSDLLVYIVMVLFGSNFFKLHKCERDTFLYHVSAVREVEPK